jgi:two-component system, OmpR family, KDP operon response regulator KdpE
MNQPRILIIEDENDIRRFVRLTLVNEGMEVFEAENFQRGLIEAGTRRPDLMVIDLGLPDGNGVDLIKDIRGWSSASIVVLSARSSEHEKIEALDAGADDYLVKPFGAGELMARVRAQLRRQNQTTSSNEPKIEMGAVSIDLSKRLVEKNGDSLHLTPIEYKLLTFLLSHAERVITHEQLVKAVWGPHHVEDKHYVRVHMANLRRKIEDDPARPHHIQTVSGVGYRLNLQ